MTMVTQRRAKPMREQCNNTAAEFTLRVVQSTFYYFKLYCVKSMVKISKVKVWQGSSVAGRVVRGGRQT